MEYLMRKSGNEKRIKIENEQMIEKIAIQEVYGCFFFFFDT